MSSFYYKNINRGIYYSNFEGNMAYEIVNGYPNAVLVLDSIAIAAQWVKQNSLTLNSNVYNQVEEING